MKEAVSASTEDLQEKSEKGNAFGEGNRMGVLIMGRKTALWKVNSNGASKGRRSEYLKERVQVRTRN